MATEPTRPDPDTLLAKVEREEAKSRRGRLKVFFGAAAGVGKTYTMLQAARERRAEGADVLVGLIETHGRKDTAALLDGLAMLPTRAVDYRGARLQEFDLDAALARKPGLILVDELAHTNAPGSRHPKRWQDVDELLEAGINVYTTLNVQHLESLNDDVNQIAGIRVWETVPDTVFEGADEVELVDLPPDELLIRLREGKVYFPEQARRALENFFRKGNLIALRELALRQTATRVDAEMQDYRLDHAIGEVWQVTERILVCIGPNPLAERLIRAGKRLANGLKGDWIVAYVETPQLQRLAPERRDAVLRMLRLAEQLGAEAMTLSGAEIAEAVIRFAHERNVTKIVMGKPSRRGWSRWLLGSVVDTVIAHAHNINLYLLGSPAEERVSPVSVRVSERIALPPGLQSTPNKGWMQRNRGYLWAIASTAIGTVIGWAMFERFDLANLVMVYLVGVMVIATRYGRGPSILASILSVAAFDLLFVKPYFSFSVGDTQYLITLLAMLAVAMVISNLMANVRYQARVAAHRERRATVLYRIGRELVSCRSESEVARCAVRHVHAEFDGANTLLFAAADGRIANPKDQPIEQSLKGCDLSVAQWVYDHNEMAGQGTNTLAGADAVYLPLVTASQVTGVLVIKPVNLRRIFLPEQRKLLEAFLDQIAGAIERVRLIEQTRKAAVDMEGERLRNSLLSSISHDLRTPLATIVGSSSTLVERDAALHRDDRLELGRAIYDEARRMTTLVNNILDMARLDAGAAHLNRQWHMLEEIIGTVLTRLEKPLDGRTVTVRLPDDLPLLHVDAVMIEQVLVNLLENAIRHTPAGSPITISAERSAFSVVVAVADRGPGIPKGMEEQLFEKFCRLQPEQAQSGVGLGLAICRAIIEAHDGWIRAHNRGNGGAVFTFMLPIEPNAPTIEPEN